MSGSIQAMMLAAGFGTRLRPLSNTIPKALLPIHGRPLLEWNLRWLASVGVGEAALNAHHQADPLREWLDGWADAPRVRFFRESEILGTAGGLANARVALGTDPVLVLNMDQLFRPPIEPALRRHREGNARATLFLVRHPELAQIEIEGSRVTRILPRPAPGHDDLWAFTGVYLLSQDALRALPTGRFEELGPWLRRFAADGTLAAHCVEDWPFRDLGTPEGYWQLARELTLDATLAPRLFVSDRGELSDRFARESETLTLPGIAPGAAVQPTRSILGPDHRQTGPIDRIVASAGETRPLAVTRADEEATLLEFVARHGMVAPSPDSDRRHCAEVVRPLTGDGSSRRLFRVVRDGRSRVVVWNPPPPPVDVDPGAPVIYPRRHGPGVPDENESFVYVAGFLAKRGLPAPRVLAFERQAGLLLVDDLGDTLLFDRVRTASAEERAERYGQAIEMLARLHETEGFDPARVMNLDYDPEFALRFEAGYFHREMVSGWARLDVAWDAIESDAQRAARLLAADAPRGFLHRDYQSRNLMVTPEGLAVIDFQGARLGPPEYDLASLLYDPYVQLEREERERWADVYRGARGWPESGRFTQRLQAAVVCRMMQALGAFAYLGGRLGKPGFLEHAPLAAERLGEAARDLRLESLAKVAELLPPALSRPRHS